VGFVVDKVASGQVFSEYFGFPCHSFHQILHPHNHPGQVQQASKWPTCLVDTVWTPPPLRCKLKKKHSDKGKTRQTHKQVTYSVTNCLPWTVECHSLVFSASLCNVCTYVCVCRPICIYYDYVIRISLCC
jgi:hypothetical protein